MKHCHVLGLLALAWTAACCAVPADAGVNEVVFCVKFSYPVFFAVAFPNTASSDWVSTGWIHVRPNECKSYPNTPNVDEIFWRGDTGYWDVGNRRRLWTWGRGRQFPVLPSDFVFESGRNQGEGRPREFFGLADVLAKARADDIRLSDDVKAIVTINEDATVGLSFVSNPL